MVANAAFQACCGLNIIYGFNGTQGRDGMSKDSFMRELTRTIKGIRHNIGAGIVALNSHQMKLYRDWLIEFGFDQLNDVPYAHPGHKDHSGEVLFAYRFRNADFSLREPTWVEPPPPEHPQGKNGKWRVRHPSYENRYFYSPTYSWVDCSDRYTSETSKRSCLMSYSEAEAARDYARGNYDIVPYVDPNYKEPTDTATPVAPGAFGRAAVAAVAPAYDAWPRGTWFRTPGGSRQMVSRDNGAGVIIYYGQGNGQRYSQLKSRLTRLD